MPAIKSIVVKNMSKIALLMMVVILFLLAFIQISDIQQNIHQDAHQAFYQVEQLLDENSRQLEQIQEEYTASCLNNARTAAYILAYNPKAKDDSDELKKIAADMEVDEINIFDSNGVIVAGTHPEYFGYSFDSGKQMRFFKPLLTDKFMEIVQNIMPNTVEGKLVQYSALWSEDGEFIIEIGMYPASVLQVTEKNDLSYIFSLLETGDSCSLYAVDPDTQKVVGATDISNVNKHISEIGFQTKQLGSGDAFYAKTNQTGSYCLSKRIGENDIIWTIPVSDFYKMICIHGLLPLIGLILLSVFLVCAVLRIMNRTVVKPTQRINEDLRSIQNGNFQTKVDVQDSKEFLELSTQINQMVASLLENPEKMELSKKIEEQKEQLEKQQEQLKIAVERAEAANKTKTEFLFHMSHDIRTPMNAILGFTNLALENQEPEIQKEYLENIHISSKQLLDMLNDILELASIESHKTVITEQLSNVKEIYKKLHTIFDRDLKKKNLTYIEKQDIKHPYMYVDTTHYTQIFLNIISNAVKFTPNGGRILVSFSELPRDIPDTCMMETIVEDNGIGMSDEFLAHVYESFARERSSTISGVQGTGLGLTIVKNLVELMDGTIHIESQQDKGTKVTIRIPHRLGERFEAEKEKTAVEFDYSTFKGKHVLLAEDIDINAVIATKLLSAQGFLMHRAKDGAECIDMLLKAQDGFYELVLMDIQMPNMDGYEATRSIRSFANKKKASIPILAMTANTLKEDREKAAEAGMNGYIAKPLNAAVMFQTIAAALQ